MIPQLARLEEFPLYDIVSRFQPTYVMSDFFVYSAAPMTEIDAEQLSHFGMGVFWKAAVHNWRSKAGLFRIDLGPYADEIRRFLLNGSFPEHAALWVCVVPPTVPLLSVLMPFETYKKEFHIFTFYVPGVTYYLCVGKAAQSMKDGCFARNPSRPFLVSPHIAFVLGENYRRALSTARISPKYAKQRAAGKL